MGGVDGIHDLGGMHGFGAVDRAGDDGQPRFHAPWEGRVVGMFLLTLLRGWYNIDAWRHGIECLDPVVYLRAPYFERWRRSLEAQLVRAGVIGPAELAARVEALRRGREPAPALPAPAAPAPPTPGYLREPGSEPRFAVGDAVRPRNLHPRGHTRLPRYVRGRPGRVVHVRPGFVFPDSNARGEGERPQWLYNVRFEAAELWSGSAEANSAVHLDLFESYLAPDAGRTAEDG
jgi:nitrile hydratase beta subunit